MHPLLKVRPDQQFGIVCHAFQSFLPVIQRDIGAIELMDSEGLIYVLLQVLQNHYLSIPWK